MCSVKLDPSCLIYFFLSITRYVDEHAVGKQKEGESIFLFGALIRIPVISARYTENKFKKIKTVEQKQVALLVHISFLMRVRI